MYKKKIDSFNILTLNVLFIGGLNRKKGFRFENFKQESGKNITNDWLSWFIGLYEGDGSMTYSKKGFSFVIYSIDKKTLLEIKNVLGFGNIYYDSLDTASMKISCWKTL